MPFDPKRFTGPGTGTRVQPPPPAPPPDVEPTEAESPEAGDELEHTACYTVLMGSRHAFRLAFWPDPRSCKVVPYSELGVYDYSRPEDGSSIIAMDHHRFRIVLTGHHFDKLLMQLRDEKVVRIQALGANGRMVPDDVAVVETIEFLEPEEDG